jgi:hypothetical protein
MTFSLFLESFSYFSFEKLSYLYWYVSTFRRVYFSFAVCGKEDAPPFPTNHNKKLFGSNKIYYTFITRKYPLPSTTKYSNSCTTEQPSHHLLFTSHDICAYHRTRQSCSYVLVRDDMSRTIYLL